MAFFDCLTTKKNNHLAKRRSELRQHYRAARRALPSFQQQSQARQLGKMLKRCPEFNRAKHIASYLPNDGEIDPAIIHQIAWALGKHVYLPVLTPKKSLRFTPYTRQTQLVNGPWGIKQPQCASRIAKAISLDLILVPLVAFDRTGNRLGRGGGYYDRFLSSSSKRRRQGLKSLGLGHTLQEVKKVPIEKWDMPLNGVVTPMRIFRC